MPRIQKRPEAEDDLEELFVRIGSTNLSAARRFREAFEQACERLAEMAALGSRWESAEPALSGLRLWPIRKFRRYVILYRPQADGIEVLRVVYGLRDFESLFGA